MKNSGVEWIGEIPEDWEVSRVKNFLSERTGGAWGDEKKNNANDIICLRIADFDYSRFKFNNSTELTIRNYNTDIIEKLLLKKDDILVEKSGGGDKTPVGRAVIFEKTYKALFANFMDRLRVRNNISALFFLYVWTTYYDNKYMLPYVKQTTGIQNLDITSILSSVFFPLPPKSTQQRIASYLDKKCSKIEETIQNQQLVIEKLKAYKQSLITEAVTGKVKIVNGKACGEYESYKKSGIDWIETIPDTWCVCKIKYICTMQAGKTLSSEMISEKGLYPVYGGNGKRGFYTEYNTEGKYILIGRQGALCGNVHLVNGKFWATEHAVVTTPNRDVGINYLFYLLSSMNLNQYVSSTAAQPGLSVSTIINLKTIIIKSIDDQKSIVDYLDKKCTAIDTAIEQKQELIVKLTEYKKSLIYEVVTGKKEI